jgi:hypothetical protein
MKSLQGAVGEASCGRPEVMPAMKAFEQMCYKLETTCEQNVYTMDELHKIMADLYVGDVDSDLYSLKHVKRLLQEKYGDR